MSHKLKNKAQTPISLIAHNNPKSPITEQYRHLRTNIEFALVDTEFKSIVITSPAPSEGKTTTAANLAIVLAQQEKQVLLVDADLRKPSIHYAFKVSNMNGLTNVLTKKSSLENAISKTHVSNLDILTSGPIPPNPAELLNSKAMKTIIEQLYKTFDYIVFDTPPALAVADPQIMANNCDAVVMVVTSGKTNNEAALKTKKLLEKAKAPLIGVVLNGVESKANTYHYQYK
nr:CpsD/CapB family tyrosine-protein kinase [uncultured Bacillus sp.]